MSVRFKKFQNKMKKSANFGKWYARAVVTGTVDTKALAEEISHSCTLTLADISAVLIELSSAVKRHLLNSESVKIDNIGSFRVGIRSAMTDKKEDLNATKIKGYRVTFTPEKYVSSLISNGNGGSKRVYSNRLIDGVTAQDIDSGKKDATGTADAGTGNA